MFGELPEYDEDSGVFVYDVTLFQYNSLKSDEELDTIHLVGYRGDGIAQVCSPIRKIICEDGLVTVTTRSFNKYIFNEKEVMETRHLRGNKRDLIDDWIHRNSFHNKNGQEPIIRKFLSLGEAMHSAFLIGGTVDE